EFFDYCLNAKIVPLFRPAHSTHLLQPLDVGLFRPLQHYYTNGLDSFIHKGHAGMSKGDFLPSVITCAPTLLHFNSLKLITPFSSRILMPARRLTFIPENILSTWEEV
ncbi:hypothetical protein C7212DRAFT_169887, partial [Tuber magnatum]